MSPGRSDKSDPGETVYAYSMLRTSRPATKGARTENEGGVGDVGVLLDAEFEVVAAVGS